MDNVVLQIYGLRRVAANTVMDKRCPIEDNDFSV